jgi:hypothetical protein
MADLKDMLADGALRAVSTILTAGAAPGAHLLRTAFPQIDQIRQAHLDFVENREKDVERLTGHRSTLARFGVTSEPVLVTADLYGRLQKNYSKLFSGAAKAGGDLLRLGDSIRDPTVMNVLQDFGRATFIFEGINGALGASRVALNKVIAGGGNASCAHNAVANVANESGQITVGLDGAAHAAGTTLGAIVSPSYRGVAGLRTIGNMFTKLKLRFEQIGIRSAPGVTPTQSLDDLAAKSAQFKDPIAFGIMWKGLDNGSHAMSAINRGGLIYYVDQFGEFLMRGQGMQRVLECVRPFRAAAIGLKYTVSQMDYILPYAYRVYKVKPPITGWGAPPFAFVNFQIPVEVVSFSSLVSAALGLSERVRGEIKRQTMISPNKPTAPSTLRSNSPRLHPVQKGDTLFGLAKLQFGDPALYRRIVEVNPFLSTFAGHQQLPEGTTILLPGG